MNICIKFFATVVISAMSLLVGSQAYAQWSTRSNIFGGVDIVTPDRTYTGMPNIFGGMDFRGFSTRSNIFGGVDIVTPDRTYTGMPNIFGGMDFRGKFDTALFADKQFCTMLDSLELADAVQMNDAARIMGFAWDLCGAEKILGKVDKKTSSAALFETAAKLAVEQGNEAILKQIIALAPDCKKYEEQLALKGKTRGMNKSVTAFAQLRFLPEKDWQKTLAGLQEWEQPVLDRYICTAFRGMDKQSADTVSVLVNEGRITMNPQMIAMGALELSKYPYNSELGVKLEPSQIFAEAVELAIAKQDSGALKQIAALYETADFKTAEFGKYIQNELAILGNTRGITKEQVKFVPGDFSPINFHNLVRTVYNEIDMK